MAEDSKETIGSHYAPDVVVALMYFGVSYGHAMEMCPDLAARMLEAFACTPKADWLDPRRNGSLDAETAKITPAPTAEQAIAAIVRRKV
jgi:hypothetical protein